MKTRHISLVALMLLLGWATAADAQSTQFSLGIGYQWVDLSGNGDMYKSQINEDDGFFLDDLTVGHTNADGYSMRVDAAGFGGNPSGRLRLESALRQVYRLRFNYSRAEHYSALPMLANPVLGRGIVPGQHTIDRRFDNLDLDVEFLPGRAISPVVGYSRSHRTGSGTSTVFAGQDEFLIDSAIDETVEEYRAGLGFNVGGFAGNVTQGWRSIESTEDFALAPGAGGGNNTRPVVGRDVTARDYSRTNSFEGSTPFTTARVAGRLGDHARLVGTFTKADLSTDSAMVESIDGSLVSFDLARYFGGRREEATGKTDGNDWRGEIRLEAEVVEGVEFSAGYLARHRELDGAEVMSTLYSNTTNFSGLDPRSIEVLLDAANALSREEKALEGTISLSGLGPARFWISATQVDQEIDMTVDAAQVVIPGGQDGSYDRSVRRVSSGLDVDFGDLSLAIDMRREDADEAVMRTDFTERERWRARGTWDVTQAVHVIATAERMDASNPQDGIDYDDETTRWGVALNVEPSKNLGVRFGYDLFRNDSTIKVRIPQDFTIEDSIYHEDGEALDAGLNFRAGRFSFDGGYSQFKNGGEYAFTLNRTYARCDLSFGEKLGAGLLYDSRDFSQPSLAVADYEARRYSLVLRWQQ
ncbi:MAG: hypothetical protein HY825_05665 [Acidobacteria bacterium]|nr:hypothetical protein [Acidobacteriota bacterium]